MPTPQINIRVPAQHHDLMRRIAVRLRESPMLADAFTALCDGGPEPESRIDSSHESSFESSLESSACFQAVLARLQALEAGPAKPAPPASGRYLRRGQNTKAIPEGVLAEAQRMKDEGKTLREIVDTLGLDKTEGGLKNALWKRRKATGAAV